jgi:hypothetical protein
MNYMNVLSDFEIRVNRSLPAIDDKEQLSKLEALLVEKEKIIEQQSDEIEKLTKRRTPKTKPGRPSAVKKEPKTSLQELAHELMTESNRKTAAKKTTSKKTGSGTKKTK